MITKEQAQKSIDLLDAVSKGGLPINSLPPLMQVAQALQDHINDIDRKDKEKSTTET